MMNNQTSENRIDWIDFAKGIGILLVIVGHTVWGMPRGAIFSFHMPLFFILSAVTFKHSSNRDEFVCNTKRTFGHLIIPLLVVLAIDVVIDIFEQFVLATTAPSIFIFIRDTLLSYLFCSCVTVSKLGLYVLPVGIVYFFAVLFLGRTIYDYLQMCLSLPFRIVAVVVLSAIGVFISRFIWLPFSLDIALAVLPFFLAGDFLYRLMLQERPFIKMILATLIWAGLLMVSHLLGYSYLEIAIRNYPLFPLFYIIALAGAVAVCCFSVIACRLDTVCSFKAIDCRMDVISAPVRFIGRNSLYLFIIHHFDSYLVEPFIRDIFASDYGHALLRVVADLVILGVVIICKKLALTLVSFP